MKILFITSTLCNKGGTDRVVTTISNALTERGISVSIAINTDSLPTAYPLSKQVTTFYSQNVPFARFIKTLNIADFDLVMIHTMHKLTSYLLINGIRHKNLWSYEHITQAFNPFYLRWLKKYLYHQLTGVICITQEDLKFYKNITNIQHINMQNPCSIQIAKKARDRILYKKFSAVGRLTYQKGFDLLLRSWKLVNEKYPDWSLDIWGEGEDKQKLEKIAQKLSLHNLNFRGNTENIQPIYANSDCLVMSSRFEGLPLVLIEAASQGLPLVSFDCPYGPSNIIENNVNGYLAKNGDIQDLADKMIAIISSKNYAKLSKNSLHKASSYELTNVTKQWLDFLYYEVNR